MHSNMAIAIATSARAAKKRLKSRETHKKILLKTIEHI